MSVSVREKRRKGEREISTETNNKVLLFEEILYFSSIYILIKERQIPEDNFSLELLI